MPFPISIVKLVHLLIGQNGTGVKCIFAFEEDVILLSKPPVVP